MGNAAGEQRTPVLALVIFDSQLGTEARKLKHQMMGG
jgi:hypothetical protein